MRAKEGGENDGCLQRREHGARRKGNLSLFGFSASVSAARHIGDRCGGGERATAVAWWGILLLLLCRKER